MAIIKSALSYRNCPDGNECTTMNDRYVWMFQFTFVCGCLRCLMSVCDRRKGWKCLREFSVATTWVKKLFLKLSALVLIDLQRLPKSAHELPSSTRERQRVEPSKKRRELTAVVESLQHFAEDALVRLAVGMRDEHVHVAARGLPPAVGTASHRHQTRFDGQHGILHLHITEVPRVMGLIFTLASQQGGGLGSELLMCFLPKFREVGLPRHSTLFWRARGRTDALRIGLMCAHYLAAAEDRGEQSNKVWRVLARPVPSTLV